MSDNKDIDDSLGLAQNANIQKVLAKYTPKGQAVTEKVCFSDYVTKINRKDKKQTRVMLITDKAIYNLLPGKDGNSGKCKRRILIEELVAVTLSTTSDEFVFHIPEEYDYRFQSLKKNTIQGILSNLYSKLTDNTKKLGVTKVQRGGLKEETLTKHMARYQTRQQILERTRQLAAVEVDSDKEDRKEAGGGGGGDNITDMLKSKDKVQIQDFELLKVLGRGAFGKVMQVRKKDDGKIYALKILKKRAIVERKQVDHTKAERTLLESLQHPFLMTLRHAFQNKEKLYLVLDYYKGGELFFHLKSERRFSEPDAKIYIGEIGMALGHLHDKGYIYRDLKPENVLLDDDGHMCLTDFGLAKGVQEGETTETFCGTPEYLAPEIIQGFGHDKAVDWWTLGILLYELTVGIPPFYSKNVNEMYNKIQHGTLRFPPFLSDACKSIITQLLDRNPKKRLGSTSDFEDVKAHAFFAGINWQDLFDKKIKPSFKPAVKKNDESDTSQFDEQFLNEPVVDSVVPPSAISVPESAFDGFTFQGKSALA